MIPKHLHFVFGLAPKREQTEREEILNGWGLTHYVCVKSAIENIRPDLVSFYLENEPTSAWWEITRPLVNVVPVKAPAKIFNRPVNHYAHKADVIRLEKLMEHGGIYLDVDVIVHRDFDPLLNNSFVIGREGDNGLCNAVILAEKEAPFLRKWYDAYRSFDDARWNYHSVILPMELARQQGHEVTLLPEKSFFWPTWRDNDLLTMFGIKGDHKAKGDFANHLWEQRARYYMKGLTPGHVRSIDTAFHRWARPYLTELPDDFGVGVSSFRGVPRHTFARSHTFGRMVKNAILASE